MRFITRLRIILFPLHSCHVNNDFKSLGLAGRVAILGAGREGLATYRLLKDAGVADDLKVIAEGQAGSHEESRLLVRGVMIVCPLSEAGLEQFDVLIRSPGISPYRESMQRAVQAGVRIISPTTIWFALNQDQQTIVITGTKGKSTTASLLAHMLKSAGLKVCLSLIHI